jgi:alcohol dehydrogenase (cytochrome c)
MEKTDMRYHIVLISLFVSSIALQCQAGAESGPTQIELSAASDSVEWLLPNHDYAGQRFVDLKQINRDNAAQLRPVCIYQAGDVRPFPSNPLVYKGSMYLTTITSTIAIDAATCATRWRYDWQPKAKEAELKIGNVVRNPYRARGVALKDGMLVRSTSDGYLIALDAETGKLVWERAVANAEKYELMNMAPLAYGDLVITGIGISEFGVKGWIGGFRLANGEPVWRFNTVPDEGEPGAETWNPNDGRARGGGGVWVTPSLDTVNGLLYVAVGNPVPDFFGEARTGKNLYTAAMVVLDVKTGTLQWFQQFVPHDLRDWDLTVTSPLYSAVIDGTRRSLVSVAGKDGHLRAVDREGHKLIYEMPLTTISNADIDPTIEGVHTCPGVLGGFEWSSPSYNPTTNALVAPTVDWCGVFKKADELRYIPGQLYMGGSFTYDPVEKSRGWLTAVNASTGDILWKYESKRPMLASVTATSADLVFTGELTGDSVVLDGRRGDVLYRFNTGGPVAAGVITYAVNGKQYVAVTSGATVGFWRTPPASSTLVILALP